MFGNDPSQLPGIVFLSAAFVFALVQSAYYLGPYLRPCRRMRQPRPENPSGQPPVSVIVYAKNESHNLEMHLPALLSQQYPEYEVIVINDGSTDESDEVLARLGTSHPNLYHTFIPQESKYLSRRKLSLTLGVKAAKHDILFFIEANCRPMNDQWLASMVKNYGEGTMITLGYCAYTTHKGFLHKLIGYDNLISGVQYISAALAGRPYSGSGRNLSYRKQLFFEHKGFSHSLNLHAGDDDLFVNESATRTNTRVEYTPGSITEMAPVEYFKVWQEMKVSRASTAHHYRGWQWLFYRVESLTSALFLLTIAASLTLGVSGKNPYVIAAAALLYILLYITKAIVLSKLATMLRQHTFTAQLPLLELSRLFINTYVLIYRTFRGKHDYTFTMGSK
jgi:glycosyltransferase involved in cell wall biosynthesis